MLSEKLIEKYKKFVGKTFGSIRIDGIDLSQSHKNRLYFACTCLSCGRKFKARNDLFTNNRSKHVGCVKCMGKWRKQHFEELYKDKQPKEIREKYSGFKGAASARGIPFNLTVDDVGCLCKQKCHYCGKECCMGIDRVDNSKGYTTENCVPCCGCCNKMKMDLEFSFFLSQIEKIYNNLDNIKSSTTISKESTSKTFVDGNGVHLSHRQDGDIV